MNKEQYRFLKKKTNEIFNNFSNVTSFELNWKRQYLVNNAVMPSFGNGVVIMTIRGTDRFYIQNEVKSWLVENNLSEDVFIELAKLFSSKTLKGCSVFKMKRQK